MSQKAVLIAILLSSLSFQVKAQTTPPAKPNLTAEQVVEKNIAARGGLSAWRAVQTISMSGKMEAGGNEQSTSALRAPATVTGPSVARRRPAEQIQLPFRMELKRPRKLRMEIDVNGQTAVQVYDGTNGWRLRPFLNRHEVEPYTADQLKEASRQPDVDGPLVDYAAKGTKVELEGVEKVLGKDTYRLKLTYKNGETQKLWVNAQTFLETKIDGSPRRLDGKMHNVEVFYRDFKTVNGLLIPSLMETVTQGVKQTEKITVEKIIVNPKLEDDLFAKLK